VNLNETGRNLK